METMTLEDTLKWLGVTKENENGRVIYKHKDGDVIDTYTEDIETIMGYCTERLDNFFELLEDNDQLDTEQLSDIGQALVRDTQKQLERANRFIRENFGTVEIERASYRQMGIMGGTRLGVRFIPAKEDTSEQQPETEDSGVKEGEGMSEETAGCPVPVDDGFFTIHGALGKLEILSDTCHSDATKSEAFIDVCMLIVDDVVNDVGRGLKSIARAYPGTWSGYGEDLKAQSEEDGAKKGEAIEGLKGFRDSLDGVVSVMENEEAPDTQPETEQSGA